MAEFDSFYGDWEDAKALLEKLTAMRRFVFVIDMAYAEPLLLQFTVLTEEIEIALRQHPRLYLWSDEYSRFPASFIKSKGSMAISPVSSGPALDFTLPRCFERDGELRLVGGTLMYQSLYQDPETEEWYKPPEALKQTYNEVRGLLCKGLNKRFVRAQMVSNGIIRPVIRSLWIGPSAMSLLEAGKAMIQVGGEWRKGSELRKTRSEVEPLVDEHE